MTGDLELIQELEVSSNREDTGADTGVVVVYKLEMDDTLSRVQEYNLGGIWPRSMAIRDNLLVVIDQYGDSLEALTIDQETGKVLAPEGNNMYATPSQPSFVDFMD